jgi:hydroxyacylglutathione hydrolase
MSVKQPLHITAIAAFNDNYLWLIHDQQHAIIVDPGDAAAVLATLASKNLKLVAILLTHHHADHAGGVLALLQAGQVPVYGPAGEQIAGVTHPLAENDVITVSPLALELSVIDVPGHTAGHIAYYERQHQWLFCGDTLFAGGCGRLFEGTPAQMTTSLAKLAALPDATEVYCAHEYTVSNLRFACAAEPGNAAIHQRLTLEQSRREQGKATVPSTIGIEKATNPFLRYREPGIIEPLLASGRLQARNDIAAFAALREWKNSFR